MSGFVESGNFGEASIKRAQVLLVNIENGVERAIKSALPRAVTHLRTESVKRVRERYAISAADVRANENVKASYSYGNNNVAAILFNGEKLPLIRFQGSGPSTVQVKKKTIMAMVHGNLRAVHPGRAAHGRQLKGSSPETFKNAFTQRMPRSGHVGIFERNGGKTVDGGDAISQLMGSAIPQMIGNKEVMDGLSKDTGDYFSARLDHEVTRLLNGWGR